MKDECLICGAPLIYLEKDAPMECALCRRTVMSRARCVRGHFVCDDCHRRGIDVITGICLQSDAKDPAAILETMMAQPFCHMHGPEHHIMVGAALATAYRNAGGAIDLKETLEIVMQRGKSVPGGACGFWGACGAAVGAGIFLSAVTKTTPLSEETFGLCNLLTARALEKIGTVGGPRCCKRNSYISLQTAAEFCEEKLGVRMQQRRIVCDHSAKNNQCIGKRCPFSKAGRTGDN